MTAVANDNEGQRKGIAMGVSLAVHALLILLFILYKIITPIPPFPEKGEGGGQGYELALGFSELGMGDNQNVTDLSTPAAQQESTPPPAEEAEVLTSDVDESDVTTPPKPDKPKTDKPREKPRPTAEEIAREKQRQVEEAMSNKGSGQGGQGASDTPGDAGGMNGSPTGNGQGNGTGSYKGDGYTIDLAGRTIKKRPVISEKPDRGGKVTLNIWVNPEGRVVSVTQNNVKSTTTDSGLFALAKRAALESSFYPNPKAVGDQVGTMTFVFVLE